MSTLLIYLDDFICQWQIAEESSSESHLRSSLVFQDEENYLTFPVGYSKERIKEFWSAAFREPFENIKDSSVACLREIFGDINFWDQNDSRIQCEKYLAAMLSAIDKSGGDLRFCTEIIFCIPLWGEGVEKKLNECLQTLAIKYERQFALVDAHQVAASMSNKSGKLERKTDYTFTTVALNREGFSVQYWHNKVADNELMRYSKHAPSETDHASLPCDFTNDTLADEKIGQQKFACRSFADLGISSPKDDNDAKNLDIKCLVLFGPASAIEDGKECCEKIKELLNYDPNEKVVVQTEVLSLFDTISRVTKQDEKPFNKGYEEISVNTHGKVNTSEISKLPYSGQFESQKNGNLKLEIKCRTQGVDDDEFKFELPLDSFDNDDHYLVNLSECPTEELELTVLAGDRTVPIEEDKVCKVDVQPQQGGSYLLTMPGEHNDRVERLRTLTLFLETAVDHIMPVND